jgi:hypothetical protein
MKITVVLLAAFGLVALTGQAYSQDDQGADEAKLRNDPTYSTHNYKHPNKAATARRWEGKRGVPVGRSAPTTEPLANYKRQVPGQAATGGISVYHTPSTDVVNRNYKIQGPLQPASTPANKDIAPKEQDRPGKEKPVATGDE